jgi:hypothetical protein
MRTMNLWKNRLYMKPVLIKKWQTDIAKAQSAQRDKGIKTYHACHIMYVNNLTPRLPRSMQDISLLVGDELSWSLTAGTRDFGMESFAT